MEIIKPGKVKRTNLKCPECGCEFACSKTEMTRAYGIVFAKCPQDGCGAVMEVPIGTTLRTEPAKQHTAVATFGAVLPGVTVTEEPIGDEQYITKVENILKETSKHIKALGPDSNVYLTIDGKDMERFYMGESGTLIAYTPHTGRLYTEGSET